MIKHSNNDYDFVIKGFTLRMSPHGGIVAYVPIHDLLNQIREFYLIGIAEFELIYNMNLDIDYHPSLALEGGRYKAANDEINRAFAVVEQYVKSTKDECATICLTEDFEVEVSGSSMCMRVMDVPTILKHIGQDCKIWFQSTYDSYVTIEGIGSDAKLVEKIDVSTHGSPCYHKKALSCDPAQINAYQNFVRVLNYIREVEQK